MMGASPGIAIVTALAIECSAVRLLIDDLRQEVVSRDRNHYRVGTLPSAISGEPHRVLVTVLPEDGTRSAAAICADVANSFPSIGCVVICGIAGGVPGAGVGLGDVVVATDGIVDYGHVRRVDGVEVLRRHVDGMSRDLLRAERELQVRERLGQRPWEAALSRPVPAGFGRPDGRTAAVRVHRGAIGSADQLVRDAARRDELARRYDLLAIEMETSGVAVSAVLHGRAWFLVRGVADHCDTIKNDAWHGFASLAAASYVRVLLGECYPLPGGWSTTYSDELSTEQLRSITDTLLDVAELRDEAGRRDFVALLPAHIAKTVQYNPRPRFQIHNVLRACARFPDGRQGLVEALRAMLPGDGLELGHVKAVIDQHWPH